LFHELQQLGTTEHFAVVSAHEKKNLLIDSTASPVWRLINYYFKVVFEENLKVTRKDKMQVRFFTNLVKRALP